ncbi:MAG: molybdopterin biosynthesis protein [Desulfomonilaceae bacterium]|nr:molybdopterin biosynthesis protein [Desulfomonilaceae bacterium]
MRRNIYLDMKSPEEALAIFLNRLDKRNFPASETVSTAQSRGRVTAEPVFARVSSPGFHTAAMDGFAVSARDTFGAGPDNLVRLHVGTQARPVNTGRPLPPETDAVVMIENVNFVDEDTFEIDQALVPWQNVRKVGEDFVASEMILPGRHQITPYDMGALLAGGVVSVNVTARPRVIIVPTGSELVPIDKMGETGPPHGLTPEFNSVVLAGLVEQAGGVAVRHEIVADDFESIKAVLEESVRSDANLIVINAGSSAGSEDYTAAAIRDLGEVLVHGVAMMPGKPTILGVVQDKPVMGNPGYPVSAILSFESFGLPVLEAMQGLPRHHRPVTTAVTARKIPSKLGREEFFRVKLGKVGEKQVAASLPRGAGSITTLTRADGILRIPSRSEGVEQGAEVTVELLRTPARIDRTVVVIGSHDLTLDVLADELIPRDVFLSSSHVGSLGGLLALKKDNAHVATSHLLDEETGTYNWSYIKKYLPEIAVKVFHGVMREQGFIVPKGNPKSIRTFMDLTREDVTFVNRQAGAGTRVLLDHHLDKAGIDPSSIRGYELEEYTHTTVAVAVLSGVADVGMGVLAAARALGLDFVPVAVEQYDLVIPEKYLNDEKIVTLLETIRGASFKERVLALGGYGVDRTGEEIPEP